MLKLRYLGSASVLGLVLFLAPARADDDKSTDVDRLARAVQLLKDADYEGAQALLEDIDKDNLESDDQRTQLNNARREATEAIAAVKQAVADMAKGDAALKVGDLDAAERAYRAVSANAYASRDLKSRAEAGQATLTARRDAAKKKMRDADSVQLTQADEEQPGEMTMERVTETTVESTPPRPSSGGLVDQIAEEHELLWQMAVKSYRDAANKASRAALEHNFAEARHQVDIARQVIETNRRYANPASRYDDMRAEALALQREIENQERTYDEEMAATAREESRRAEEARLRLLSDTKRQQVALLMDQATELKKEGRYDDAVQVLKQVLVIDPNNDRAVTMKETLEDVSQHVRQAGIRSSLQREAQDLLIETEEALIPWHQDLLYPKNWPEISARRSGALDEAEPEANKAVRRKLQSTAKEIKFDAQAFEQVIDYLRELTGLNIDVNWPAMETAGIDKESEVTLRLTNVRFEKALQLILDKVGGGETELAYDIDDGVVTISTKEDLSRRTQVKVYDVKDLIFTVPNFRGRRINLQNLGQSNQGGLSGFGGGGGGFGGGGGGGGGGGNTGGGLFGGGGGEDEGPREDEDNLEKLIELIQLTIDPESWRETGGNVGAIQNLNQHLIVTQTSTAHGQLRDLLKQLRQARAIQIAIEARYITISRNYLEQIGVDLDVVLNNGNAGFDRAGFGSTPLRDPATGALVLVPRQFSRLGFTPDSPGVGIPMPAQGFPQPWAQPGLVPAPGSIGPHSGRFTPIPITNNTLDLASPLATNIPGTLGGGEIAPALELFGSFLDNIQVDFLLRATQVDKRQSDLDAPRLVLFNGQRAVFEAFIEQDYVATLTPVVGDNVGLFFPGIATALTGRSLDVQATVSADRRYVTMTVETFTQVTGDPVPFQFSGGSLTGGAGFVQLVRRTTQQIRTTVSVPDGGTLLIGGLKLAAEREVDAGVPILSRIPILKRAFSNSSLVKDDQVLLILIKPKIIIQEEAEAEAFPTLSSGG